MVTVTGYVRALNLLPSGQLRLYDMALETTAVVPESSTTLAVAAGIWGGYEGSGMGGSVPDARVWDAECRFPAGGLALGAASLQAGEAKPAALHLRVSRQTPWTLFSANENSLCIAWAGITWPDESAYVWIGDWARACGRDWYYSNLFLQGHDHKPACQWIDNERRAGNEASDTGFSVHWPSFTLDEAKLPTDPLRIERLRHAICESGPYMSHKDKDPSGILCAPGYELPDLDDDSLWNDTAPAEEALVNATTATADDDVDKDRKGGRSGRRLAPLGRRRPPPVAAARRSRTHDTWLVVTDDPTHSAEELCAHPNSRGPNLVNVVEGSYCHMLDKSLWPVCTVEMPNHCFDKDSLTLKVGGLSARGAGFDRVVDWTGNSTTTFTYA